MSVVRIPTMLEQSIITMQGGLSPQVLANLGGASSASVSSALVPISATLISHSAQIASISGINIAQATQLASISGINIAQATQIADISAGLATAGIPRSEVAAISAGLVTDIGNVDAQLTLLQADSIIISGATSPATGTATWFNVSISGAIYKLGVYVS